MAKTKKSKKREQKKAMTNLMIIDASTSMDTKTDEVIGGIKQIFKQIKEDAKKDEIDMTTIVLDFSSRGDCRILVNSKDPGELKDELADQYKVRGMTALYDAIGKGFSMIDKKQDGVFINILTDGQENNSAEFTKEMITKLIEDAKTRKWAVTFMGTTEEALKNAREMGIAASNTAFFDDSKKGVMRSMKMSMESRSMYYNNVATSNHATTDSLMELAEEEVAKKEKKKDDKKKEDKKS